MYIFISACTKFIYSPCLRVSKFQVQQQLRKISSMLPLPSPSKAGCGTVHILGVGNIGMLFASFLARKHGPNIVNLLFHRESLVQAWDEANRETVFISDKTSIIQSGFGFEVLGAPNNHDTNTISNLIVTTKATNTVAAIKAVRHRLTEDSTIMLCQNGIGILDELNVLFSDTNPKARPQFLAAIVSHGVYSTAPFRAVHAGKGTVTIGPIGTHTSPNSMGFLTDILCRTPELAAVQVSDLELLQAQLKKLVVNSIINPLTVLFNCHNGQLFRSSTAENMIPGSIIVALSAKLMDQLLSETCLVLQALPEIQEMSGKERIFSVPQMKELVIGVADKTSANTSSMLQDFRAKRATEIDYINGYVIRKGAELGIDCGLNKRIVKFVRDDRESNLGNILESFPELREYGICT